jgi:hypothetical protein
MKVTINLEKTFLQMVDVVSIEFLGIKRHLKSNLEMFLQFDEESTRINTYL